MRTVALDLGLNLGIADRWINASGEEVVTSGVLKIKEKDFGKRMLAFEAELKMFPIYEIEFVIETVHGGYYAANKILFGMIGVLYRWAEIHNIPVVESSPKETKKWATGSGNADKTAMVKRANELSKKKITDHNEADAYLLLKYHLSQRTS